VVEIVAFELQNSRGSAYNLCITHHLVRGMLPDKKLFFNTK
jgi:hypothetical protein